MTKERMRVVIGEWMGWKSERDPYYIDRLRWRSPDGAYCGTCDLPEVCEDLNAIHGMIEDGLKTRGDWKEFNCHIAELCKRNNTYVWHATAELLCAALIRTIGRWEEDAK